MLQALLGGKLSSSQENMEDVLTSCVFGSFRYMNPNDGLGVLLKEARGVDRDDRPFSRLSITSEPRYLFWPFWDAEGYQNCEPDVVVEFEDSNGNNWLVLIEVKFRSGKSAYADDESDIPTDQLAKEWDQLLAQSAKLGSEPMLVYVTSDVIYPSDDINNAIEEYRMKRKDAPGYKPMRCYWLSWRSLYRMFENSEETIGADLRALANKLGLKEFDGFSSADNSHLADWRYSIRYEWFERSAHPTTWRYKQ